MPTHGHTQGHASVVLASGGEKAIYIGDMIQHPVQLERAPWVSSFDIYPLEAMETKKAVVARAIAERQLVVAVHCAYPGLGYMTQTPDGKNKWTPVEANGGDTSTKRTKSHGNDRTRAAVSPACAARPRCRSRTRADAPRRHPSTELARNRRWGGG